MFGADTALMFDAMQIAVVVAGVTGTAVYLLTRRLKSKSKSVPEGQAATETPNDLEARVRVLERIATDQSVDLADEIEALRDNPIKEGAQ